MLTLGGGLALDVGATVAPWTFEIGKLDKSAAEFALAPTKQGKNEAESFYDSTYVVGVSRPEKDWSYLHSGLRDGWAYSWRMNLPFFSISSRFPYTARGGAPARCAGDSPISSGGVDDPCE